MRACVAVMCVALLGCFDYGAGFGGGGSGGGGGLTDGGSGGGSGGGAGGGGGGGAASGYLGVVAGFEGMDPVSGSIRFSKQADSIGGTVAYTVRAGALQTSSFTSDGGLDGGQYFSYLFVTNDGLSGLVRIAPTDGGEVFTGNLRSADGGLSANMGGGNANGTSRAFCGTFSGAAAGTWNFVTTSDQLSGAYAGLAPPTLRIGGNLSGTATGASVSLRWSELFASGTASGIISGSQVSGVWAGYSDGGTWSSTQACPGL